MLSQLLYFLKYGKFRNIEKKIIYFIFMPMHVFT